MVNGECFFYDSPLTIHHSLSTVHSKPEHMVSDQFVFKLECFETVFA